MAEHLYQDYTQDQFTALLVDQEWEDRQNRKIKNLIRQAGFRLPVSTHDIDYTSKRKLDKNQFERLLGLQFLPQAENIIFTGSTGVGKSYLAQAIGTAACQMLYKVQYYNTARLMEEVKISKLDGSYIKLLKRLQKMSLLILAAAARKIATESLLPLSSPRYR